MADANDPAAADHSSWRQQLGRLELLGLPLLPCGAGKDGKSPLNPQTGYGLAGWETAAFSVPQILAMNGAVRSVGTRTGDGRIAFDIDGGTALELCLARGCDPQQAHTWQVHRDTDPLRLKVLWMLTPDQQQQLGALVSKKLITRPPIRDDAGRLLEKAEAVELFHHTGRQVILLGQHPTSGGHYFWPDGCGPEALAPIPMDWWALALECAGGAADDQPLLQQHPQPVASGQRIPLLDLVSRETRIFVETGGTPGQWNDDQLTHSLDLIGTEAWIIQQGHSPEPSARDAYGLHIAAARRQDRGFDERKAWQRFDRGIGRSPHPSTPEQQLRDRLRYHTRGSTKQAAAPRNSQQQASRDQPQPDRRSWKDRNFRKLSHERSMACLDRCVEVQAQQQRNSLRRRARLLKAAADLGLAKYVNRQEIAQRVLEAKDRQQGHQFQALSAQDRRAMPRPVVRWVVKGLLPEGDLTIVGGRPKVGKTRFAIAVANAVLNGTDVVGYEAVDARPVLLVTDDQADGDSADMLQAINLWDHEQLIWSRHFRLAEHDLDALLAAIKRTPGVVVILDSLRSISRSLQFGENDAEIGALLYDLKAAVIDAGGTLLLIHHCNKAEGLVGTEALSGHNAIAGAANTVMTLHYLPDDKGRPLKDEPQRRIVREARSGQSFDLVISPMAGTGAFYAVGTYADWQQSRKEASDEEKQIGRMNTVEKRVIQALTDAQGWRTRRQVCEALGFGWENRGRNPQARQVERALDGLARKKFLDQQRCGNESSYRIASGGTLLERSMVSVVPASHANGFGETTENGTVVSPFSDPGHAPTRETGVPNAWSHGTDCNDWAGPLRPLSAQGHEVSAADMVRLALEQTGASPDEPEALTAITAWLAAAYPDLDPKQIRQAFEELEP